MILPTKTNWVLVEVGLDDTVEVDVSKSSDWVILPLVEIPEEILKSPDHRVVVMDFIMFFCFERTTVQEAYVCENFWQAVYGPY